MCLTFQDTHTVCLPTPIIKVVYFYLPAVKGLYDITAVFKQRCYFALFLSLSRDGCSLQLWQNLNPQVSWLFSYLWVALEQGTAGRAFLKGRKTPAAGASFFFVWKMRENERAKETQASTSLYSSFGTNDIYWTVIWKEERRGRLGIESKTKPLHMLCLLGQ